MGDLFRTLARRALGQTGGVQPRTRGRYEPRPTGLGENPWLDDRFAASAQREEPANEPTAGSTEWLGTAKTPAGRHAPGAEPVLPEQNPRTRAGDPGGAMPPTTGGTGARTTPPAATGRPTDVPTGGPRPSPSPNGASVGAPSQARLHPRSDGLAAAAPPETGDTRTPEPPLSSTPRGPAVQSRPREAAQPRSQPPESPTTPGRATQSGSRDAAHPRPGPRHDTPPTAGRLTVTNDPEPASVPESPPSIGSGETDGGSPPTAPHVVVTIGRVEIQAEPSQPDPLPEAKPTRDPPPMLTLREHLIRHPGGRR